MKTSISVLLERKGSAVFSVPPTVTAAEAVQEMNRRKVGSVLIMEGDRLLGIFTERDVLSRVVAADLDPKKHAVAEVMTSDVLTISRQATVEEVMTLFGQRGCRHLPVVDAGRVVGLVSIGDISRWVADVSRHEAEQLKQYIAGGYPT
jgi:CBS domain-containing protein